MRPGAPRLATSLASSRAKFRRVRLRLAWSPSPSCQGAIWQNTTGHDLARANTPLAKASTSGDAFAGGGLLALRQSQVPDNFRVVGENGCVDNPGGGGGEAERHEPEP